MKTARLVWTPAMTLFAGLVALAFAGCGGGGYTQTNMLPPPIISISLSPTPNTGFVQAGGTVQITATANGDTSNKGVTWTISPASGAGTLSNMTSTSVTYTAPSTPPPNDVTVTITATSVTDPTQSNSIVLDFAAIQVLLSASVSPVGATGTSVITATVNFDPKNAGVNSASWTLTLTQTGAACSPSCGTLSGATNSMVTYTAPAAPPASDMQLTITSTSASDHTRSGSVPITFAAIQVLLGASPSSLQAQGTSTITATVNFDPAKAGVTPASWAITSPVSGGGTLSNPTATSVTYTAPASPPTSNLAETITAASASDSTKSGSTTVTVLAITISLSPTSALVPVSTGSVQFTGTVANDPTVNPQVSWSLSQNEIACTSTCGSFSAAATTSGTPVTYMPPSTVPTPPTVTVTGTSVTDMTKSANATVKLTKGTVEIVPDSLDFGTVRINGNRSETVALTNTGSTPLSISGFTSSGGPFSQTNTCGTSVAAGMPCTIKVTFSPKANGTFNGTLSIADSSTDSPQLVSLSGRGLKFRFNAVMSALVTTKTVAVPSPMGPNRVGTRVLDLVDSTREDPFLANGVKRELLVRFWYPASPGQNCKPAEYTSLRVWNHFSELLGIPLPAVTTNSCSDARITDGAHPVVLFTHGYTGTFTDYTFLFEDLASRGYVVASVDHTFEATAVEFPDGRFVESAFGSYLGNNARSDEQTFELALSVRLSDLKFMVNELERLNAGSDRLFAGKLDISSIAVAGHSLGGLTAILGIEQESRFKAGIILDGIMPNSLFAGTRTPVLILAPGRDEWRDDERRLWSNLRGPRLAVNLTGTEHMTPSDAVWLATGAIKTGTMGPEKTIAAVRNYIAAFLDTNLRGKLEDPLLTGPSVDYPDAVVTTEKQMLRREN